MPDLAVGETYWIVLEVETGDPRHLGSATLSYFDAVAGAPRMVELSLDDLHDQHRDQATNRLEHDSTFLADAAGTLGSSKLASDRITLRKLLSLTQNLDKQTVEADTPDARSTLYALGNFGRINNGHVRLY